MSLNALIHWRDQFFGGMAQGQVTCVAVENALSVLRSGRPVNGTGADERAGRPAFDFLTLRFGVDAV